MSSKVQQDINAVLAAAERDIYEVDTYEAEQRKAAEERHVKKAKALATIKQTRPLVIQQAVNEEKDRLAALVEKNKRAVADAQAQLKAAVKALSEAIPAVQAALDKVNDTYMQHDKQAESIYGFAYNEMWNLMMMDQQQFIDNYGAARAEGEISRQSKQQGGSLVGALPAANSPIVAMLLAIQAEKNPTQRRLLQGVVWAISDAPNGSTADPADDWQPPAHYQLPNRGG